MLTLLHLFSSVSLLVWGTHIVRTGVMRVFGASLRQIISSGTRRRSTAFLAGVGVTALVQSSNATALLVISFVSHGLIEISPGLIIMLGADVGTALMAKVLTVDLSWLSPLLILVGVTNFLRNRKSRVGQLGRVGIGLGLIILALQLIVSSADPITHSSIVRMIFTSISGDPILALAVGTIFAMVSYSSLAAVLLIATLAAAGMVPLPIALCIVLGSNLGSGLLAVLGCRGQNAVARQIIYGSMVFKIVGCVLVIPWIGPLARQASELHIPTDNLVINFHVTYNFFRCLLMMPFVGMMARLCQRIVSDDIETAQTLIPRYLDYNMLDVPSLALTNATRETLRLGDVVSQMLYCFHLALTEEKKQKREIHKLEIEAEILYSAIKLYMAQIRQDDLEEEDSRRWAEIIDIALNMHMASSIIEHMVAEVTDKALDTGRSFSSAGIEELLTLYQKLKAEQDLAMAVFLSSDAADAKRLKRAKHRLHLLNRRFSYSHVERLHCQNVQSLETSSLHMRLLGDIHRLSSLFCSPAHHVLENDKTEENEPA